MITPLNITNWLCIIYIFQYPRLDPARSPVLALASVSLGREELEGSKLNDDT